MSELGFAALDTYPLQVGKGDQLVLIRIPRSVHVKDLHGKKVDIKKNGKSSLKGQETDAPIYFEFSEDDKMDNVFRPIVSSLIDGSTRLGPKFTSSIIVQDGILELPSIAATDADELPIVFAYNPKPQWEGMHVHTLPIGSKSTLPAEGPKVISTQKAKSHSDQSSSAKRNISSMEGDEVEKDDKSSKKKKKKHDK